MDNNVSAMETLSPGRMAWRRALEDPVLRNLPYKIETNEFGQLVMSPVKRIHGMRQAEIVTLLREHVDEPGVVAVEIGIDTPKGVRAPDVVWTSEERWTQQPADAEVADLAPEICVEVLSPSNTQAEIDEKRLLYFDCGAQEFWTCDVDGRMHFFTSSGERPRSRRVPNFPNRVE